MNGYELCVNPFAFVHECKTFKVENENIINVYTIYVCIKKTDENERMNKISANGNVKMGITVFVCVRACL